MKEGIGIGEDISAPRLPNSDEPFFTLHKTCRAGSSEAHARYHRNSGIRSLIF